MGKSRVSALFGEAVRTGDDDAQLERVVRIQKLPAWEVMEYVEKVGLEGGGRSLEIVAWVLGELGHPEKPFLAERFRILASLAQAGRGVRVRSRAIVSLGQLDPDGAKKEVLRYAEDRSPAIRVAVAQALGRGSSAEAFGALCRLSKDDAWEVRDWAVFGLGMQWPRRFRRRLLAAVKPRLEDADESVRIEALRAWVEHRGAHARDLLVRALEEYGVDERLLQCVFYIDTRWVAAGRRRRRAVTSE